jgi:hypothetical protein
MEWDLFTLMTDLNPSLQWKINRACSETRFQRITRILVMLVQGQLGLLPMPALDDPPSDDFFTQRGSAFGACSRRRDKSSIMSTSALTECNHSDSGHSDTLN